MSCQYPRSGIVWLITLTVVGAAIGSAYVADAGLYECRDSSGAPIYTDSPAQLDRCQPVANGGTSRLELVGGTTPSAPQVPDPVNSFPPPETLSPMSPYPGPAAVAPPGGLVPLSGNPAEHTGSAIDAPPCTPGINPLNPFTGPPCNTPPQ
jgi:hypothetical protein